MANFGSPFGNNFGNLGDNFGREAKKIRRSPLAITLIILFILSSVLIAISSFYADILWFKSVGYSSVWKTTLFTKAWLDRKSTRLNSSHIPLSRMPSSA